MTARASRSGSFVEVLVAFARLGCTSFGGPVAHVAYFRRAFVVERGWLSEIAFAQLLALCQFLPGPASSKLGFAIGLVRGGYAGGLAAWLGFTLPSAIVLAFFALGTRAMADATIGAILHGLMLVAVAVVAQAVLGMARALAPDAKRAAIAFVGALVVVLAPTAFGQVGAIATGMLLGVGLCQSDREAPPAPISVPIRKEIAVVALLLFVALLAVAFVPSVAASTASSSALSSFLAAFYRTGALVFGGGHVVLPLLHDAVVDPGWIDDATFVAGYGAAQAVPGPLFTFATFLGAAAHGVAGAVLATIAIFLPGLLLQVGALPFWNAWRTHRAMAAALDGANAAVVGVLAIAWADPVVTSAVRGPADAAIAIAGIALLVAWRWPSIAVIALTAIAGALAA